MAKIATKFSKKGLQQKKNAGYFQLGSHDAMLHVQKLSAIVFFGIAWTFRLILTIQLVDMQTTLRCLVSRCTVVKRPAENEIVI